MSTNIAATAYRPEVITAFGRKGAGPIPFSGVSVGEAVIAVINIVTRANAAASFESTVTKNGQVQQTSASDLSGQEYFFVLDHLR